MSGKRAPPRLPPPPVPKSSAPPHQVSEQYYQELVAKLPSRAPIFLPTERMSLEQRIDGVKRVQEIYKERLDEIYRPRLRALREKFQGRDRCFVIGNGPSLNKTDLSMLRNEVTFAVNGIFLKSRELGWQPTFYVVEDHLVAEDRREWINAFEGPIKLFPAYLGYCIDEAKDTIFFNHRPRVSYPHGFDFSRDAAKITYTGCTVTFTCLQLAHYLGFKSTYLIGVDADYELPKDVEQSQSYGVGVLDMKSDDPNHFNPDYFGKGFRWHDPQVDKMLDAYAEARKVVDQTDQRIYNAGIGGRLEVFERIAFGKIFPDARPPEELEAEAAAREELRATSAQPIRPFTGPYPKLLLLDHTRMGDGTATGEVKATILGSWSADRLMQVYQVKHGYLGLIGPDGDRQFAVGADAAAENDLRRIVADFGADLIVYRPVPRTQTLHLFSMDTIAGSKTPLATWIMDDWPAVVAKTSPDEASQLIGDFERLLERSSLRLSIGTHMSEAFEKRYGGTFVPFANGVDPSHWPRPRTRPPQTFTVRYAGSLAEDMGLESVLRIAKAVEQLSSEGCDIKFEIKTRPYWHSKAGALFEGLGQTTLSTQNLTAEEYRAWLSEADVLVIAYNFDQTSIAYVRYSIANKLPESLASGAVVLAHGPPEVATIKVLQEIEPKLVVPVPSVAAVRERLSEHARSPFRRLDYAEAGQRWAFNSYNVFTIRDRFARTLADVVTKAQGDTQRRDAVEAAFKALVKTAPAASAADKPTNGSGWPAAPSTAPPPPILQTLASPQPASRQFTPMLPAAASVLQRPLAASSAGAAPTKNGAGEHAVTLLPAARSAMVQVARTLAPAAALPVARPLGLERSVDIAGKRDAWRQRTGLDIPIPEVMEAVGLESGPTQEPIAASPIQPETATAPIPLGVGTFQKLSVLTALTLVVGACALAWLAATAQLPASAHYAVPALAAVIAGLGLIAVLMRFSEAERVAQIRLDRVLRELEAAQADGKRNVAAAMRQAASTSEARIEAEQRQRLSAERQLAANLHSTFVESREATMKELDTGLARFRNELAGTQEVEGRITALVDERFAGLLGQIERIENRTSEYAGSISSLERQLRESQARATDGTRAQTTQLNDFSASLTRALDGLDGKVGELAERLATAGSEREQAIDKLETRLKGDLESVSGELKQLVATDKSREEAIAKLEARLKGELDGKSDDLAKRLAASDVAREQAIAKLETRLKGDLQSVSSDLSKYLVATEKYLVATDKSREEAIAKLEVRLKSDLDGKSVELSKQVAASETTRDREIAELEARLKGSLTVSSRELESKVTSTVGALKVTLDQSTREIGARLGKLGEETQDLARLASEMAASSQRQAANTTAIEAAVQGLATSIDPLKGELAATAAKLTETSTIAASATKKLADPVALQSVLEPLRYQSFNRRLSLDHVKMFQSNWLRRLSVPETPSSLAYMAHRIQDLEARSHGRLATSIEDAILRCLLVKAVKGPTVEVLEIGTLFGIGATILYDTALSSNRRAHLTLIDPLQGYYDAASLDSSTRLSVSRSLVRRNMYLAGVQSSDVTLIERMSTDPEAVTQAATRSYDLLVIDGDHSYAGVAADFRLYAPLVKIGGFVVFDDYNKPDWPDVQKFVDGEMPRHDWCAPVGSEWTTSVFRIVGKPPSTSYAGPAPR